jgi:hypothetical protein
VPPWHADWETGPQVVGQASFLPASRLTAKVLRLALHPAGQIGVANKKQIVCSFLKRAAVVKMVLTPTPLAVASFPRDHEVPRLSAPF